ncbi:ABC transporter ATP-binding protein [Chitinophaga qingshengii]|uniref:ABC transporter ATP-binding protein n=1 Tax=Chitinophaga qingshengii TaxID=1569794 RepID=A0ABR7TH33_9BACT|nr:ABC transporter ATP-binding protein [Chitinophaga qingshengii]MBC9929238.1 ABC transporter ATP-binding protein [Chitinophaga qingshengii]
MMNTLELESVRYEINGRKILSDVYLKMETGKVTALAGRNGEGKTSLFRIMYGTLVPETGAVFSNKVRLSKQAYKIEGLISFLPQVSFIPGYLRIAAVFNLFSVPMDDLLAFFPEFRYREKQRFGDLSGGEQRLLEAFLVIKAPTLFTILDEPFTHLMPVHVERLMEVITAEKQRKGFLIADHQLQQVLALSDSFYYLRAGIVTQTDAAILVDTFGMYR